MYDDVIADFRARMQPLLDVAEINSKALSSLTSLQTQCLTQSLLEGLEHLQSLSQARDPEAIKDLQLKYLKLVEQRLTHTAEEGAQVVSDAQQAISDLIGTQPPMAMNMAFFQGLQDLLAQHADPVDGSAPATKAEVKKPAPAKKAPAKRAPATKKAAPSKKSTAQASGAEKPEAPAKAAASKSASRTKPAARKASKQPTKKAAPQKASAQPATAAAKPAALGASVPAAAPTPGAKPTATAPVAATEAPKPAAQPAAAEVPAAAPAAPAKPAN